jgi:hypothetical protein
MKTLGVIILSILVIANIGILVYWIINPSLTYIQVFIKFWWIYLIQIITSIIFMLITDNYEKK